MVRKLVCVYHAFLSVTKYLHVGKSLIFKTTIFYPCVHMMTFSEHFHLRIVLLRLSNQFFTLKTGDLLYTGTPAGVGPVSINDHLEGWLEDRKVLEIRCK